jgi:hypothetical protein
MEESMHEKMERISEKAAKVREGGIFLRASLSP